MRTRRLWLERLERREVLTQLPLTEVVYLSTDTAGQVTGSDGLQVKFDDSDIVRLDLERTETGEVLSFRYRLLFDGSDVGLTTDDEDLDALAILPDGRIVISTTGRAVVPGVTAEDEDLLLFTPSEGGLGYQTAGAWSLYFDGSDVGLATSSEDADALAILPDGRLVISTAGSFRVPGVSGRGEDLLLFTPTSLGETTSGSWSLLLDGSQHGLTSSNEGVDAVDLTDDAVVHLSTSGPFSVASVSGDDEDVFSFDLLGRTYQPDRRLDGSRLGLGALDIDAIEFRGPDEFAPEPNPALPVIDVAGVLQDAAQKLAAHDAKNPIKTRYAGTAGAAVANWSAVGAGDWTAGFYPGLLWQMYAASGEPAWLDLARQWTAGLESQQHNTGTHDVGFMIGSSFGQGIDKLPDPAERAAYEQVVVAAARSLSSRFHPTVGAIRSWNGSGYRVIVDNLMNLEMLFQAARLGGTTWTGGSTQDLYQMAVTHAATTLRDHVRPDGSTYHIVNYSPSTGKVVSKSNGGGISKETTWTRGQAWAVYGFTATYRETNDPTFLDAARRTADYFLSRLPDDFVPASDFSSRYSDLLHKDSSAAAIAASALLELATLDSDPVRRQHYYQSAVLILESLTSPAYFAPASHPALLLYGATNHRKTNVSLIYADYYLVEAVLRYRQLAASQQQPVS